MGLLSRAVKAFHGSPHHFERFSLKHMGSGEGAQAYGKGLYFAENEGVAKWYRDQLTKPGKDGAMYEVKINANPEDFIDLNLPIGKMPKRHQELIAQLYDMPVKQLRELEYKPVFEEAEWLRGQGVPGFRFLDEPSRAAGSGTRNYVVNDDALIEVLRKYGVAGLMAGGAGGGLLGVASRRQEAGA